MNMIKLFQSLTKTAKNIVITTHLHPDADGIGSEVALCLALKELGKNVICVNEVSLLERYRYLDPKGIVISHEEFKQHKMFKEDIDLFIVADTNSLTRIGSKVQEIVKASKNLLFIDHHPCPKELAAIHCIDTTMAATGELVATLIESVGVSFTKDMALALYTSILIDTSSFRYPTVSGHTHEVIAKLMATGIEPPEAYNAINGTKKVSYIKLLGIVLSSAESTKDGRIAWLKLSSTDLDNFNVEAEDTHGFVNHLLILNNIKVACMFREIDGQIKISFRSAGDIDVGVMAQALGGGGHNHSAATIIYSKALDEVIKSTVQKLEIMLDDQ